MSETIRSVGDPNLPIHRDLLIRCDRFSVERAEYIDAGGRKRWKDVIRHPGAVVILPILDDGRLCLIRNRRITVGETLLEVPAGTLDPSETPEACAYRELKEETGYTAGKMDYVGSFYVSPGILDERMHLFFATDLTAGEQDLMPDEQIVTELISHESALNALFSGEIKDAKTMISLLRYPLWQTQQDHG